MDIPIIINNRDRLSTLKNLTEQLVKLNYTNIHILDNLSSYEPLLKWYETCNFTVRMLENLGPRALWDSGYINEFKSGEWLLYTDSDISLGEKTPEWFIQRMIDTADRLNYNKIGLALQIDDLPNTGYATEFKNNELQYWKNEIEPNVYIANVDTTIAIIKQGQPFDYKSLRIAGDYTAKHLPWYNDPNNLSEEEKYIIEHSSSTHSTTKRYYDSITNQSN